MFRRSNYCRLLGSLSSTYTKCSVFFSFIELLFYKEGKPHEKGDKIKNEKYAKTLEKIQEDPKSFYKGLLAKDIASDIGRANGIVSESDLSAYQTVEREPLESELSGRKMYLTPPPTSGAVLGLILNILKGGCNHQTAFYSENRISVYSKDQI